MRGLEEAGKDVMGARMVSRHVRGLEVNPVNTMPVGKVSRHVRGLEDAAGLGPAGSFRHQ